jgi:tetratricopeptide (TPR) repeat protein
MRQDQSELDSYLSLYGPDGIMLGQDDDSGGGYDSRTAPVVLAETGVHFIASGGFGDSAGAYQLTLQREPVSEPTGPEMLVERAREDAQQGKYKKALAALRQAVELDPELEREEQRITFEILVGSLGPLVETGDNQAAEEAIRAALDLPQSDLGGANGTWNNLCWWGSLYGFEERVVDGACERAVDLANKAGAADAEWYIATSRDGRGLARALTGDVPGAIEDFTFFVEWGRKYSQYLEYLPAREEWIERLEAGEGPAQIFDAETLEALKFQ